MILQEFFEKYPKVAIAFSGGVDSAFLLYAAKKYGAVCQAYYVKSVFQPQFELEDACKLAKQLEVPMRILTVDTLENKNVVDNPPNRCYFCKHVIFETIRKAALEDGFSILLDGTNASDDASDRPGMQALRELSVLSPLRECGLTKKTIRALSREAGLFTWDKPAYACLATRIATGEIITEEKLKATEETESFLFSLGFQDFRIRQKGQEARIQVKASQINKVIEYRESILSKLKEYYKSVCLDLEVRE